MPLSADAVIFPDPLPSIPFTVRCVRSATRSGLIRGALYRVIMVIRDAVTHRGSGAKGYVVTAEDSGECLPVLWHPSRFTLDIDPPEPEPSEEDSEPEPER